MSTEDAVKKVIANFGGNTDAAPYVVSAMEAFGINTPNRIAHFLSQVMHESQDFKRTEENLNYSADRLLQVFPRYFKTKDRASKYARNPQAIANRVYSNRLGNGSEASGDGWKYRGGGFIQATGKVNYKTLSDGLGVDFVNNPEYLRQIDYAAKSAAWWWNNKGLNQIADKTTDKDNMVQAITKKVNGGVNGLSDRLYRFKRIKSLIG